MRPLNHCSALLFDGSHAQAPSRLYTEALKAWIIQGDEPDARERLHAALTEIEAWVKTCAGQVVVSLSFESAAAFSVAEGLILSQKATQTP
ncbi:MAG TPA: hypothetical protein PLM98_14085, partial [Thiolinea sp.]|nr:hypothetical protein [Thiolinea sp.]